MRQQSYLHGQIEISSHCQRVYQPLPFVCRDFFLPVFISLHLVYKTQLKRSSSVVGQLSQYKSEITACEVFFSNFDTK